MTARWCPGFLVGSQRDLALELTGRYLWLQVNHLGNHKFARESVDIICGCWVFSMIGWTKSNRIPIFQPTSNHGCTHQPRLDPQGTGMGWAPLMVAVSCMRSCTVAPISEDSLGWDFQWSTFKFWGSPGVRWMSLFALWTLVTKVTMVDMRGSAMDLEDLKFTRHT